MIQLTDLSQSDHTHFAKDLFESAFPDEERPPFGELKHRNTALFHFMVATNQTDDGDDPVGILTYWTFDEFVYIEHFAIAEELRNQGLGKQHGSDYQSLRLSATLLPWRPNHCAHDNYDKIRNRRRRI